MIIETSTDIFNDKFIELSPENEMEIFNLGKISSKFKHLEIHFKSDCLELQQIDSVIFKQEELLKYLFEK